MELQIILYFVVSTGIGLFVLIRKCCPKVANVLKEDPKKKHAQLIRKKLNLPKEHVKEDFQKSMLFGFFEPKRMALNVSDFSEEKTLKMRNK